MNPSLKRTLKLWDLIMIVIGTVIGSGIFIVPAVVLRQTEGSIILALAVWLVAGALSLLGALTYGELGAMRPEAGGIYVYIREAFGALPAFLYGWTLFFVIASASVATLAVAFASYLNQLVPFTEWASRAIAIAMIVVVMLINIRGTRHSASVQNWTTAAKVGAIVLMSALLFMLGDGMRDTGAITSAPNFSVNIFTGLGLAMIAVLWAYEGWQYLTFSAGETLDPQRTFARGLAVGTIALVLIYVMANVAYMSALGIERAMQSERIAAEAVSMVMGPFAGKMIAAAILVSMFSAANGITLTASRVFYAMARDGVFFQKLAEVHPRFGTPAAAIVSSLLIAIVFTATGTFEQLLTYVVFTGWIFYALGAASIFVYRRKFPEAARSFRVPGYPFTPMLFVLSALAIVMNTIASQPSRATVGIAVVLVGTPVFYFWRGKKAKEARA